MPEPVVSIIMPAYNAAAFIAEAIESVLRQTYSGWELLIVNDGSEDNTQEIIDTYQAKEARIKCFTQQNSKQGKARNVALAHASGNYIAFLDADDVWIPVKLEIQLQELKETKADLVFSEAYQFENAVLNSTAILNTGRGFFSGEAGLKSFLEVNKILPSSVLARTEIIKNANGFTEKPSVQNAEDYYLWLQLLMNGNVLYGSKEILVYYRIHPSSASYHDKMSLEKTVEVLQELKKKNKPYKDLLNNYHKIWFMRFHYSSPDWSSKKYKALIKKNCSYIYTPALSFLFQTIYFMFGLNTTRIVMNKFINNYKQQEQTA